MPHYTYTVLYPDTDDTYTMGGAMSLGKFAERILEVEARDLPSELYDEHGELTLKLTGPRGRALTARERNDLLAILREHGAQTPSEDEAPDFRASNPRRRSES